MTTRKLYQWVKQTSKSWTDFTAYFQENVTVFSRGVVLSQSSHIRKIASAVSGRPDSQRRRLQRFVKQDHDMNRYFSHWTKSIVNTLRLKDVVLIIDETKLKARFGVMVVALAIEGRSIPLAWRIYHANDATAYPAEGQVQMILTLLKAIQGGLPPTCSVRVLADRGIGTSPDLMKGIMALNWYFLFRVTKQSKVTLANGECLAFYDQVKQIGEIYEASGTVFKKRGRIPAHVRVLWGAKAQEPWALVTNDPRLTGWEYAQRNWIEQAFRDLKSYGWQLESNEFRCPQRLERFWILLVVAYAWMILWGLYIQHTVRTIALKKAKDGHYTKRWSLFREGRMAFLAATHPT